jgi:hypothetical protein
MTSCLSLIVLSAILLLPMAGRGLKKFPVNPSAVAKETPETQLAPQLFSIARDGGWPIPGESQCRIVLKTTNEQLGGAPVQKKDFECSGELPLADVEFYYMRANGQLYIRTDTLAAERLSSYSLSDRIFAYRVDFAKVDVHSDGSREYFGAIFIRYYYDEDGDGKFEMRYDDLQSLKLPDWYQGKRPL